MKVARKLEMQECEFGYPVSQLERLWGKAETERFINWHTDHGKTYCYCDGRKWLRNIHRYIESCNGVEHGDVYYWSDVKKWNDNLAPQNS